ncbi:MAG: MFS transporter, partial [Muribaculaceae bacterium]|nr:MFS transporter [Muribaculaceae bacterium]
MIQTGKAPISMMTFCAILSISLVVNLPGLAVTPMLGSLSKIFPDTTQLEKQLLTVLPNLVIIPFVFLSGKLSLSRHKIAVIVAALVIFTACAIAYLFADSMVWLIVVSCVLGCGAGLIIPFSKGLIADTFEGKYRMDKMGLVSGISNTSLVAATFAVGWLSHGNWHLPFVVYLVCLVPLFLSMSLIHIIRCRRLNRCR